MRSLVFAVAAIAVMHPSQAQAQAWTLVHSDTQGEIYIDAASVRRSGDEVHFWEDMRHSAPQQLSSGTSYDRSTSLLHGNCREMSYRVVQSSASLRGRVTIPSYQPSTPRRYAQPGTLIHSELERACGL